MPDAAPEHSLFPDCDVPGRFILARHR